MTAQHSTAQHSTGNYKPGFTLSELLISLSVLGLISALTLPAVFNSVNIQRRNAVIKETYNTLVNLYTEGRQTGSIKAETTGTELREYFKSKISYTADCTSTPAKCPNLTNFISSSLKIFNGAYLGIADNVPTDSFRFFIDWNGGEGPNSPGPAASKTGYEVDSYDQITLDTSKSNFVKIEPFHASNNNWCQGGSCLYRKVFGID